MAEPAKLEVMMIAKKDATGCSKEKEVMSECLARVSGGGTALDNPCPKADVAVSLLVLRHVGQVISLLLH